MLATFTELKAAVASWLHRVDLTSQIPDAITLAEAQFNRAIRHRKMEMRATATATEFLDLPYDYIELRRIQIDASPDITLELLDRNEPSRKYSGSTGTPRGYVLIADQIQLAPPPDATYTVEIDYYQKIPALSASNPTNWLLTDYPDLYLAGSILAMSMYVHEDQRMPMVQSQYAALINDVNQTDRKQRFSGSAPYTRAA